MSRVGKLPITLPPKTTVKVAEGNLILVEGPKGKLSLQSVPDVNVSVEGSTVLVTRVNEERFARAMHGTTQRLIRNMLVGVTDGFRKDLEIHGVGFRAAVKGSDIDLSLGQSHPRLHKIPAGLKVTVTENTKISIEGADKQAVGQLAAEIRAYYPPEPYKGKGVRFAGEQIRRKAGKSVK